MQRVIGKSRAGRYNQGKKYASKGAAKKKTKLNIFYILSFFGVFIFSFLFYTWVHMQVVHISYEIVKVNKLESEFLEINKKLKTEIATLKTPVRIKQLAKDKLGLNLPEKDQVIIIK